MTHKITNVWPIIFQIFCEYVYGSNQMNSWTKYVYFHCEPEHTVAEAIFTKCKAAGLY
jgi:hypothetical protein